MLQKYKYVGLKHLWQSHAIFNQEIIYDRIPNQILPFDYDTAFANPMRFEIVTTNCRTGRAEYHTETHDRERMLTLCKASASLPFVAPICPVDGEPMLDGGITDPIPVERAISQGFARNVVVLTHNRGYRDAGSDLRVPKFVYKSYPRLRGGALAPEACLQRSHCARRTARGIGSRAARVSAKTARGGSHVHPHRTARSPLSRGI